MYYTIRNRGNITAPAGHDVGLYIDGAPDPVESIEVAVELEPGEIYNGSFNVTLNGMDDEITICADINDEVEELIEENNCTTNIWPVPVKGDLNALVEQIKENPALYLGAAVFIVMVPGSCIWRSGWV